MFNSNASSANGGATYIEDVFSTYLYTGNGGSQTITNGIDLAGKGGLVWCKARTTGGLYHTLTDTVTGASKALFSNDTSSQLSGNYVTAFGTTGFSIGNNGYLNYNNEPTVSWTFRKQPKFFDVVTYTGNGTQGRTISHSLGSAPACIIIKCTSNATVWRVYHTSLGNTQGLRLDSTAAAATSLYYWNNTTPTSTVFTVGDDETVNQNGYTYVAYIFAHDAGGFGLAGTDNVISCGSFTDSSGSVTLGYEPQLVLYKCSSGTGDWTLIDTMRGLPGTGTTAQLLYPNTSGGEAGGYSPYITSTGLKIQGVSAGTYIYIAIRKGPMKVPTDGTKVFAPVFAGSVVDGAAPLYRSTFPVDAALLLYRPGGSSYPAFASRLNAKELITTSSTAAATSGVTSFAFDYQNGWNTGLSTSTDTTFDSLNLRRAPGFFDQVCYTGTGSSIAHSHNLTVVPELLIVKKRSSTSGWLTYSAYTSTTPVNTFGYLDSNTGFIDGGSQFWTVTASSFTSVSLNLDTSGQTYVAYLFATCAGVSKVGSYTGTGTTKQIDCGFAAGARFVLIKRTDSTGDWYVWDSARGIVAGNDPYILLNTTAAEVTSTDYVDTYAAGFELSSTAPAAINASGGTYIFLAIA